MDFSFSYPENVQRNLEERQPIQSPMIQLYITNKTQRNKTQSPVDPSNLSSPTPNFNNRYAQNGSKNKRVIGYMPTTHSNQINQLIIQNSITKKVNIGCFYDSFEISRNKKFVSIKKPVAKNS